MNRLWQHMEIDRVSAWVLGLGALDALYWVAVHNYSKAGWVGLFSFAAHRVWVLIRS